MENIVNAEADTPDKFCYRDKAEKLSCKKEYAAFFLKMPAPRYKEDSQLNVSLMSETW
ncbi:hypothetical protein [Orientia tsutsugamushi]|uniref:hypothetical protein n=1 Tax=Orientia tsutsugamushi TaxID=784 RepID=UPI0035285DBC